MLTARNIERFIGDKNKLSPGYHPLSGNVVKGQMQLHSYQVNLSSVEVNDSVSLVKTTGGSP